jgi:hypothetical protein
VRARCVAAHPRALTLLRGREEYTDDHLARLVRFQAKTPWNRELQPPKEYCSKVHEAGCKACVTCHFCRSALATAFSCRRACAC